MERAKRKRIKRSRLKIIKRSKFANFLISFNKKKLREVRHEVQHLLRSIKQKSYIIEISEGLAHIRVGDARKAVADLEQLSKKSLRKFNKFILHNL